MRSIVRWAGSKQKLLGHLSGFWPEGGARYVEAFAGSASLFFHLAPDTALLNDINVDLINAFRALRRTPTKLHRLVSAMPATKSAYNKIRALDVDTLDATERAVRFFYLNRHCFNGIYRTNLKGDFNVPFSASGKTGAVPELERWLECAKILRNATLRSQDFETFILRNVDRGDFVYLDPPYAVSNRRVFSQYSATSFGTYDLERLSNVLFEIDARGATFVVSYAQSPETSLLLGDWHVERRHIQRNVAGFAQHRRRATEVLISNRPAMIAAN